MRRNKKKMIVLLVALLIIAAGLIVGLTLPKNNTVIGIIYSEDYAEKYIIDVENAVSEMINVEHFDESNLIVKITDDNMQSVYENVASLSEQGCNVVIVICEESKDAIEQIAIENPKIDYCVFRGEEYESAPYTNIKCFNFAYHELRYAEGYLAGLKIKEMADNGQITDEEKIIGYIADEDNPENVSSYSALYLGAKAADKDISFFVKYAVGQYDAYERTAKAMIANGYKVICQQTENDNVGSVCTDNNTYFIGDDKSEYNILSKKVDLCSYIKYILQCKKDKKDIENRCCGFKDNAFEISVAENDVFYGKEKVQTQLDEVINKITDSTVKVFDTGTWTVSGKKIETTLSEDGSGTEYINPGGYFAEGEISPNPQFAFNIDGLTILK